MRLAAEIIGTITSVLSISLLVQFFSNDRVLVFQVNFCAPNGADHVTPTVKALAAGVDAM